MFAIRFEMFYVFHENLFKPTECFNVLLTLVPRVAANNLCSECDVNINNEAKLSESILCFPHSNLPSKAKLLNVNYTKSRRL